MTYKAKISNKIYRFNKIINYFFGIKTLPILDIITYDFKRNT